jgi:hypothetical protein
VPSYSPVFSQQFIADADISTESAFEVPSGFTAVIRQISGYQSVGAWQMYVYIQDGEEAPGVVIYSQYQAGVDNYVTQEGRWMVPEAGIITAGFDSFGAGASMYVGGYLLRNTLT